MKIPGQRIRDFREALGWSANDLARACSMRESYLLDIEEGNLLKVHTRTYQKIADALGISLLVLNGDEEPVGHANLFDEIPGQYRAFVRIVLWLIVVSGVMTLVVAFSLLVGAGFFYLADWGFEKI